MNGLVAAGEELAALDREQLVALVAAQQGFIQVQAQTIEEIVDERDAARLLNELCHY